MILDQFETMISFANACKYSSLNYVDYEDVESAEVIRYDDSLLLLYDKSNNPSEIHYATNDLSVLLDGIKTYHLEGLIKFIPFNNISQFELYDFKIHCIYQDYFLKDLKSASARLSKAYDIRFATLEEAKEISEISKACSGQSRGFFGETEAWIKEWLAENEIIVKYINGKIVGFCCVSIYGEGTTLWIRELAVHPAFQGKGIGKSLMEMGIHYGLSKGAQKSFLAVDIENKNAIRLYTYFGYEAKENDVEVQLIKK